MGEGTRVENTDGLETMGSDLISSFRSQSLPEESEVGEEPVKQIGHDSTVTAAPEGGWVKNSRSDPLVRPRF